MKTPILYRLLLDKKFKTFQAIFSIIFILMLIAGLVTIIICCNFHVETIDDLWLMLKWLAGVNGIWIAQFIWIACANEYKTEKDNPCFYFFLGQIFW